MPEPALTTEEQKYFDTRGAEAPVEKPAEETLPSAVKPEGEAPTEDTLSGDAAAEEARNAGRFVRLAALHEERERRKELSAELAEERRQNADRNARLEQRLNALQQSVAPAEERPTWDADPVGAGKAQERDLAEFKKWRQDQEARTRNAQDGAAFAAAVEGHETTFVRDHADYYDAVEHVGKVRDRELEVMGYPPGTRREILYRERAAIAGDVLRNRGNPAEVFYNLAKEMGYKGAAATPGGTPAPDKLKSIAAGQAAGKSLGAAPGSAQPGLTLDSLADLPDDEFRAIALDPKKWAKLWR